MNNPPRLFCTLSFLSYADYNFAEISDVLLDIPDPNSWWKSCDITPGLLSYVYCWEEWNSWGNWCKNWTGTSLIIRAHTSLTINLNGVWFWMKSRASSPPTLLYQSYTQTRIPLYSHTGIAILLFHRQASI